MVESYRDIELTIEDEDRTPNSGSKRLSSKFVNELRVKKYTQQMQDQKQKSASLVEMKRFNAQKHLQSAIQGATISGEAVGTVSTQSAAEHPKANAPQTIPQEAFYQRLSLTINEALPEADESVMEETFASPVVNSCVGKYLASGGSNENGSSQPLYTDSAMGTIELADGQEAIVVSQQDIADDEEDYRDSQPVKQSSKQVEIAHFMNITEQNEVTDETSTQRHGGHFYPQQNQLHNGYECEPVIANEDDEEGLITHTRVAMSSRASTNHLENQQLPFSFKSALFKGVMAHSSASTNNPAAAGNNQLTQSVTIQKKKPDVLLDNIVKLQDLIRKTSKEENPRPNYERLMRHESKVEAYKRMKMAEKQQKSDAVVEMDIISNTVEQMIAKINANRKAPDNVFLTEKFKKPLKYFDSKGGQKAQMRTEQTSLIKRQRQSTTQRQIDGLLDEFGSVKKARQKSLNLNQKASLSASRKRSEPHPKFDSQFDTFATFRPPSAVSTNLANKRFSQRINSSSLNRARESNPQPRVSQPANFFSTSPKNQDLPFKQFTRTARSKPLSTRKDLAGTFDFNEQMMPTSQLPSNLMVNQPKYGNTAFSASNKRFLANQKVFTTEQSPHKEVVQNINLNINFNVTGNVNIMTPQESSGDSHRGHHSSNNPFQNQKSSLRRPQSGVHQRNTQRRENVDFDPKVMQQQQLQQQQPQLQHLTLSSKQGSPKQISSGAMNRRMRPKSAAGPRSTFNQANTSRHSNVVKNFNNTGLMPSTNMKLKNVSSGMIQSVTNQQAGGGGGLWQKGSEQTLEVIRSSALSRNAQDLSTFITQVPSKKQLNRSKPSESSFSRKNSQAKQLKTFFQNNLLVSQSIDYSQTDETVSKKLRSQQKSLITQANLFEQAYVNNRHINAQKTQIDLRLEDKEQSLPQDLVQVLFNAKFIDLKLPDTDDQLKRFVAHCQKRNINGRVSFTDMKLGINFARALAAIVIDNPWLHMTHLNLERNLLGDEGVAIIVQALGNSQVIVSLNISSNELKPKGFNQVLEAFKYNQSLQELTLGSEEGGCMNRVNDGNHAMLEEFVVENKFLTILSMRCMGMTHKCILGVFEKLREGYLRNQSLKEELENNQNEQLQELEQRYFREDGDNMALQLLLKTKRRNKQVIDVGPIKKLALQSLDLANNAIQFQSQHVVLFQEAIGYSNIQRLDLSGNPLKNEGIKVVACCLIFRSQLRYLNVSNCGFNLDGAYPLIGTLGRNHTVETAIMDKNNLSGHMHRQRVLKDLFVNNKTLKVISLNNCSIGEGGATQISLGMGLSTQLTSLSLAGNQIGDKGVECFVDPLFLQSLQLTYFNLANNMITDVGGKKLTKGLLSNQTLSCVDLRHNSLTDKTVNLLIPYAQKNKKLTRLHLEFNVCNLKLIEQVEQITRRNQDNEEAVKLVEIKREQRSIKKSRHVAFKKVNKEKALEEINNEVIECKDYLGKYQEHVAQLEEQLLDKQVNPDPRLARLTEINRNLRNNNLEMLRIRELELEAKIKSEKEDLQVFQRVKGNEIENSQIYRDHYAKVLVKLEAKLEIERESCDKQRNELLAQLDQVEAALNIQRLKHDLVARDIEKERERQDRERRIAEELSRRAESSLKKKKKEDEGKQPRKKGGKRKTQSASVGRKKAKSKKS